MYSQDYDEQMTPAWIGYPTVGFPGVARWMDVLQPYVKNSQIFSCPDTDTRYVPVPAGSTVSSIDPQTKQPYYERRLRSKRGLLQRSQRAPADAGP
jgi:hypothetical protein